METFIIGDFHGKACSAILSLIQDLERIKSDPEAEIVFSLGDYYGREIMTDNFDWDDEEIDDYDYNIDEGDELWEESEDLYDGVYDLDTVPDDFDWDDDDEDEVWWDERIELDEELAVDEAMDEDFWGDES